MTIAIDLGWLNWYSIVRECEGIYLCLYMGISGK
jgi:hypothetical protein